MVQEKKITITCPYGLVLAEMKKRIEESLTKDHLCYLVSSFQNSDIMLLLHCQAHQVEQVTQAITNIALEYNLLNQVIITSHAMLFVNDKKEVRAFYDRQQPIVA
jgi:hypothetical protein